MLQDANSNARSLTLAWTDLENTYESVSYAFAVNHYRVNPYLAELVYNLYTNLTSVLTPSWSTASFAIEVGVFQGDPLSVSIFFNVVINTLVTPLVQHCFNLGYRFSSFQYADDAC